MTTAYLNKNNRSFSFQSRCELDDCPKSPTKNAVEEYAKSKTAFLQDFVPAFEKALRTGTPELIFPTGENIFVQRYFF